MKDKKLLLFNPIVSHFPTLGQPLGLGYLAAYLEKHLRNLEVVIETSYHNGLENILRYKPDVVGFSSATSEWTKVIDIAKVVKDKLGIPLIIGGFHISVFPNALNSFLDIGVIGEGEQTLLALMQIFIKEGKFRIDDLKRIKGIVYHYNGGLIVNPQQDLINDLDSLPYPARHLFPQDLFLKKDNIFGYRHTIVALLASRGCYYRCAFCSASEFWRSYRWHSPQYVVSEIKYVYKKYKPSLILFRDDLFIPHRRELSQLVSLIREQNLHTKVEFAVSTRVDIINQEVCRYFKLMNIKLVSLGVESFSDNSSGYLKDGLCSTKKNAEALILCRKERIDSIAHIIIGTPGETEQDLIKTFNVLKKSLVTIPDISVLVPHPRSKVWLQACANGIVDENMNFSSLPKCGLGDWLTNFAEYKRYLLNNLITSGRYYEIMRRFKKLSDLKLKIHALELFFSTNKGYKNYVIYPFRYMKLWLCQARILLLRL